MISIASDIALGLVHAAVYLALTTIGLAAGVLFGAWLEGWL